MNIKSNGLLIIILLSWATITHAQSNLQIVNIGDFKTCNGDIIKNCKIGYRTVGKLNAEKSNVVLWTTWFTGTSESIISHGFINNLIDTTGLFIVIVDALTNGVSSSPSNTANFPNISILDMVNSQYELLINHLEIDHLFAVMGISMGGHQTFEWVVAYPGFMDKAIPIVGSPKETSYDKLFLQTMADIITEAGQDEQKLDFAYKRAYNILLMNLWTPTFFAKTHKPDSLDLFLNQSYSQLMEPEDYLGGLKAMIPHDIYKSAGCVLKDIKNIIKADMLIIPATQDHCVNPISAIELSKELNAELVTLDGDCGHSAFTCETEKIKNAITAFLNDR
jgi:homoserine O-acetyltransferase/O-succinyltransferase